MTRRAAPTLVAWGLCSLVALSWALTIGRYGGPDEPAHVVRAAAVANGELVGKPAPDLEPGYRFVEVPRSIASGDPACYRHDARTDASCAVASARHDPVSAATSAGTFPPTYYAGIGLPARLVGVAHHSLAHRVVAAIAVALALAVAYARLLAWPDRARAGLVWAGITPAAWFLTGVVNTNGLEIALLVLAWVLAAELLGAAEVTVPRHLAALGAIGAAVIALRPIAVTGVLTIGATLMVGLHPSRRPPRRDRALIGALGALGGAAALVLAWWVAVGGQVRDSRGTLALDGSLLPAVLSGIDDTLIEAVRSLGWAEFTAPLPVLLVWVGFAGMSLAAVASSAEHRLRRAALAWATCTVAAPLAFELLTARRIGLVWQGRYSVGSLIGIAALGAIALQGRLRAVARLAPLLASVASTITLWVTARRYISGLDGPWWPVRGSGWWPPIGPWLPLLAHTAAALTLALGLTRDRAVATTAPAGSAP